MHLSIHLRFSRQLTFHDAPSIHARFTQAAHFPSTSQLIKSIQLLWERFSFDCFAEIEPSKKPLRTKPSRQGTLGACLRQQLPIELSLRKSAGWRPNFIGPNRLFLLNIWWQKCTVQKLRTLAKAHKFSSSATYFAATWAAISSCIDAFTPLGVGSAISIPIAGCLAHKVTATEL
jgi:hypothetical protein